VVTVVFWNGVGVGWAGLWITVVVLFMAARGLRVKVIFIRFGELPEL
jgi:hypothetical protein